VLERVLPGIGGLLGRGFGQAWGLAFAGRLSGFHLRPVGFAVTVQVLRVMGGWFGSPVAVWGFRPAAVAQPSPSVLAVCLAEVLSKLGAWLLLGGCPVGFPPFPFGLSGAAGLPSLRGGRGWFLFGLLAAWGLVRFIMPNKSVKVTARHYGWQSQFFSQVGGFAVGHRAGSPLPLRWASSTSPPCPHRAKVSSHETTNHSYYPLR